MTTLDHPDVCVNVTCHISRPYSVSDRTTHTTLWVVLSSLSVVPSLVVFSQPTPTSIFIGCSEKRVHAIDCFTLSQSLITLHYSSYNYGHVNLKYMIYVKL